jgi:hypothetical protein
MSMFYLQETKDATENESLASIGVELQSLRGVATATRRGSRSRFALGRKQLRDHLPKLVGNDWFDEIILRPRSNCLFYVTLVSCG